MKTFLQNMVMLHIKLNGMKRMTKCKHIFCPYIYFDSLSEVKMSKHFFFNLTMLQKGWSCIYNGHLYHGLVVGGGGGDGEVFFKAGRGLVYAMYSNVTWPCF